MNSDKLLTEHLVRDLAELIADDLFEDAHGETAKRLVLEPKGRDIPGTGWCRDAVVDRIAEKLFSLWT